MSVYVYAITSSECHPQLDDLHGVGEEAPPLRTVTEGALRAVVSDAPEDLRAKRRDLSAHHEVQERLLSERAAVLPMRFGLTAADDDAVRAALSEHAELYSERLAELEGRVEFNLKASEDEEVLLRQVIEESDEVRRLNEATRGGGGTYEERLALGELVAQEVGARQDSLTAEVTEALRPCASAESAGGATSEYFLNVSFLVDQGRVREFTSAAEKLAERYGPDVELRLRGPLPPYSFV
ncbi:GvpL/GvpF family gas vesicle protein [Streptomyces scopuliridis]|uniref:GvpL/GvpF family gas vesicle protein n=1 Tax=Streptomyces scopuliridis TaxID=452529 RepID=UPI002DDB88ED|nr:GvpL/GvpF family gas vesicle protein [Streptomyces scopuliridis]WSB33889.1 GvpL/GvpF family gas vesicle protein [Streptomyces scopuliridis]